MLSPRDSLEHTEIWIVFVYLKNSLIIHVKMSIEISIPLKNNKIPKLA